MYCRWLVLIILVFLTGCRSGSLPENEDTFKRIPVGLILEQEISGTILSVGLDSPSGLAVNRLDQWYLSDAGRNRIVKFNQKNEPEKTYGGYGIGIGQFSQPTDIVIDRGLNVYVLDTDNRRVVHLDANLNFVEEIANRTTGHDKRLTRLYLAASELMLISAPEDAEGENLPNRGTLAGLEISSVGEITVSDFDNSRLIRLDNFNRFSRYIGDFGYGRGALLNPMGLVYSGTNLYVADAGNARIAVYDDFGNYLFSFGEDNLEYPAAITSDNDGFIWVGDQALERIFVFTRGGRLLFEFGAPGKNANSFNNIEALAVGSQNLLYVADSGNHRVLIYRIIYEDV